MYGGDPKAFHKAGEVDYEDIIKNAPEYKEIKKGKIARGTGKYWILMSQASDRAVRTIAEVASEGDYDLVVAKGYLKKLDLDPEIPVEDITLLVVKKLKDGNTR